MRRGTLPGSVRDEHSVDHPGWAAPRRAATRVLALRRATNQMECAMRLTSALVERTLSQFEAQVIPESHPALAQLKGLFGDHTFFLDENGLNIVEPTEAPEEGIQAGQVVNLASWNSDEDPPSLERHAPEPTEVVIILGSRH
jgi:hypothetical protein